MKATLKVHIMHFPPETHYKENIYLSGLLNETRYMKNNY